ncbi:MAG: esterase-like activity of phytase family protein [Bradymonadia bacterium]
MRRLSLICACFYLFCFAPVSAREGLQWSEVLLKPGAPGTQQLGPLKWMGGIKLTHEDPRFGGYSGLSVQRAGDGALSMLAISDTGHWLRGRMVLNAEGQLRGLEQAQLLPVHDLKGQPISGKRAADGETVRWADGHWYVTFERAHRLWRYAANLKGPAEALDGPEGLSSLPDNKGIEALSHGPDGTWILLSERGQHPEGGFKGWIGRPGQWRAIRYLDADGYLPTEAALMPSGDLLILERWYRPPFSVSARLRRVPRAGLEKSVWSPEPVVELGSGFTVDNMEGMALLPGPDGALDVFLMSDDNKSPLQRTLLMHFRWPSEGAAAGQ